MTQVYHSSSSKETKKKDEVTARGWTSTIFYSDANT